MGEYVIKLPDVGEGVAEAELVEWNVAVGDVVQEDTILASVMTDKAAVEIPSPVEGTVKWLGGEIGDVVAVGSPLVRLEVAGEGNVAPGAPAEEASDPEPAPVATAGTETAPTPPAPPKREAPRPASTGAPQRQGDRPIASPAVRGRAREAGVDLRQVRGSGPAGRITHEDLDAFIEAGPQPAAGLGLRPDTSVTDVKVIGLRRRIAEKMALSKSRIAHITYVDEVDVTALEELRAQLNKNKQDGQPRLTILPFLMRAMVKAIAEQPAINAHYDDEAGVIHRHGGVHIGIAAQTPTGLVVPVVRHAEARDVWGCAAELNRLSDAAKAGTAGRDELTGSTITITSLGAMGGLVTTPVINHPEVAIVGVNKIQVRPMWDGSQFVPRRMMNLSSSFDHRVIDGWDAAVFVQRIKALLETPAMIFM
ncbi:dihydrolipoamide acetyltransferase family protein [Thalassobaculum sp.]|uniref:dihydrolipoamide acetyltransferase family protein n=1 Tax=Thalassobaculum sp. TaxID=2022740 RepID=UPI0032EC840D